MMKWEVFKISSVTFLTLFLLSWIIYVDCPQTDAFTGDSLFRFIKASFKFIVGVVIWTIGYIIFLKFIKNSSLIKKYFILLTLVASFPLVYSIWSNSFSSDRKLNQSICRKSSDDGMFCLMDWLTFDEYNYIFNKSGWLPKVPSHSESIKINYYRDEFLGDYRLHVWIELPTRPKFDSIKFSHFIKVKPEEESPWENDMLYTKKTQIGANIYHYSVGSSDGREKAVF